MVYTEPFFSVIGLNSTDINSGIFFSSPSFINVSMSAYSPKVISERSGCIPYSTPSISNTFFNTVSCLLCNSAIFPIIIATSLNASSFTNFLGISDKAAIVSSACSVLLPVSLSITLSHFSSVTSDQELIKLYVFSFPSFLIFTFI